MENMDVKVLLEPIKKSYVVSKLLSFLEIFFMFQRGKFIIVLKWYTDYVRQVKVS